MYINLALQNSQNSQSYNFNVFFYQIPKIGD